VTSARRGLLQLSCHAGLAWLMSSSSVFAASDPFVGHWVSKASRRRLRSLELSLTDHDGRRHTLAQLCDRPLLLTFFYTSCETASKCSMTVSMLALLQAQLGSAGIRERVRLLALSHQPQFDTPERLHRFATDRGLRLDDGAMLASSDPAGHLRLTAELDTPVNFNAGWVNTHGLQAVLIDPQGRPARCYSTVLWDNGRVMADFGLLLREARVSAVKNLS
jgi:protein SCO1